MSDEYLFEKQGSEPEIERLERLLSDYRIQQRVPRIIGDERVATTKGWFSWFQFGYALAFASVGIVVAGSIFAVRYVESTGSEVTAVRAVETPETERRLVAPATADQAMVDPPQTANNNGPATAPVMTRQPVKRSSRQRSFVAGTVQTRGPRLTKEEKYAYDQLMVALWITGSKLRVVQDTIDRVYDEKLNSSSDKR
jgi:hypothetical protein